MPAVSINIHDTPKAVYAALPGPEKKGQSTCWKVVRVKDVTVTFFRTHDPE